jgi:hypothetical protein
MSPRRLASSCRIKTYPTRTLEELAIQGNELGDLPPDQIAAVVFVVHPELGSVALAIDGAVAELLNSGVAPSRFPSGIASELQKVGVLV